MIDKKFSKMDDSEKLSYIHKFVNSWYMYWGENILRYEFTYAYTFGDQWDNQERATRTSYNKSSLQVNQLYTHISQIRGEQRKMRPDIKVRALDPDVSQKDINLRENYIRGAFNSEKVEDIWDTTYTNLLTGGYAAIQVDVDYESKDSFNLKPTVKSIPNPSFAFFDAFATDSDKGDGRGCGVYSILSKDEFSERWPDVSHPESESYKLPDVIKGCSGEETIAVLDFYIKESYSETFVKLSDGQVMTKKEADKLIKNNQFSWDDDLSAIAPLKIEQKKDETCYKIRHIKCTQFTILEENDWYDDKLPIIYVDGDSSYIDNYYRTKPYVEQAIDSQRLTNYIMSEIADSIVNSTRAKWMVSPDHLTSASQKGQWRNMHLYDVLESNIDPVTRTFPQKIAPDQVPSVLLQGYQISTQEIKNTLGRYQANLGAESGEQSGVAISNKAIQGNASTLVYVDNLIKGIKAVAERFLSLMPYIITDERTISTMTSSSDTSVVTVNKQINPYVIENEIKKGNYMVEMSVGPSFEIQQEKSFDKLMSFMQASQAPVFSQISDILAKNVPIDEMPSLVDRMKSTIPIEFTQMEGGTPSQIQIQNAQRKQQAQQEMQKQKEQKDQMQKVSMSQNIQKNQAEINLDKAKTQSELQKIPNDNAKAKMDLITEYMRSKAEIEKAQLDAKSAQIKSADNYLASGVKTLNEFLNGN